MSKKTLRDNDSIHKHQNLNENERSMIARHRNFNAPKICKITVRVAGQAKVETLDCAGNSSVEYEIVCPCVLSAVFALHHGRQVPTCSASV